MVHRMKEMVNHGIPVDTNDLEEEIEKMYFGCMIKREKFSARRVEELV